MTSPPRDAARALRTLLRDATPPSVRRLLRRGAASATSRALGVLPLPLTDALRTRSLDPLLATESGPRPDRTATGRHFLLLSAVPLGDSGGGQRPAQLALELLRRGHRVTFVAAFPSQESKEQRPTEHPALTTLPLSRFSAARFERFVRTDEELVVLVGLPLPGFRAAASFLKRHCGATVLYDCIDDWDSTLGGRWYSRHAEDRLVAEADVVVASARSLVGMILARGGRQATLVPNAVNTALFRPDASHPRPTDLPADRPVFLYAGSLWGAWFDWEWIRALAVARPDAAIVLVGDYRDECRSPPANLHFLGLKPHAELPAYLAHATVGLIPFRVDRLVNAVSPLKVFEYLAMRKPVAGSAMPEIAKLPGVFTATTAKGFVDAVRRAEATPISAEQAAAFARENGWSARVDAIEALLPKGVR